MSKNKPTHRDVIDAELKKTRAELAVAKHREAKLRNQIKGMTEKETKKDVQYRGHLSSLQAVCGIPEKV